MRQPDVFLFDEPLSNLDAGLRAQMRVEIARLHEQLQTTMIYVTHDQVEAMTLADRIVILNNGRIEQQGSPLDLYERPANRFVAGFLGQPKMNFISTFAKPGPSGPVLSIFATDRDVLALDGATTIEPGASVDLGVRPDAIAVVGRRGGGHHSGEGRGGGASGQHDAAVCADRGGGGAGHGGAAGEDGACGGRGGVAAAGAGAVPFV